LRVWRRLTDGGEPTYPLGEGATGVLIYAPDGTMGVQMVAAGRRPLPTDDALGGDPDARAVAYSTCLAYFGTYEVQGDSVIHQIEGSLFPNWSGTVQARPFTLDANELVLRTPPTTGPGGTVVNEICWFRESAEPAG